MVTTIGRHLIQLFGFEGISHKCRDPVTVEDFQRKFTPGITNAETAELTIFISPYRIISYAHIHTYIDTHAHTHTHTHTHTHIYIYIYIYIYN